MSELTEVVLPTCPTVGIDAIWTAALRLPRATQRPPEASLAPLRPDPPAAPRFEDPCFRRSNRASFVAGPLARIGAHGKNDLAARPRVRHHSS